MVAAIKTDFRTAKLGAATRKMLEFVEQMTFKAYKLKETNAAELRQHGFTDEDILDIAHITGYFNHINRVADALGIDLEDFMLQGRGNPKN